MHHSASEKQEIIRLVEGSALPVWRTLEELEVARSTFYRWYARYQVRGEAGLVEGKHQPRRFWNRIPDTVRQQVVQIALEQPEQSPRELACCITDTREYFISESSVYRILKAYDLVTSPAFILVSASDKFKHPTKRVNELWQTDFTQFKVVRWGYYYLSTVLDDFSRYIMPGSSPPAWPLPMSRPRLNWRSRPPVWPTSRSNTAHACYPTTVQPIYPTIWPSSSSRPIFAIPAVPLTIP